MMLGKRPRRPLVQFSLRLTFVGMTGVCIALGVLAARVARQRSAVASITKAGGRVTYAHKNVVGTREYASAETSVPSWLRDITGDDWFYSVEGVTLYADGCNDEILRNVAALPSVKRLALWAYALPPTDGPTGGKVIRILAPSGVTDAGLGALRDHPSLEHISLGGNRITDAGIEHLLEIPRLNSVQPDEGMSTTGYRFLMSALSAREEQSR
jgi:hypothetical protein